MIRKFNYTGRQRITRDRLSFNLRRDNVESFVFDAEIHLDGTGLPSDAKVFVESYYRNSYQRFDFGTVGLLTPPNDRTLSDVDRGETAFFRVKVVEDTEAVGRIIAQADRITPRVIDGEAREQRSILPVDFKDLGEELWRVRIEDSGPVLEVSTRGALAERIRETVRSEPVFRSLVFPAVVRQVLHHVMVVEQFDPEDDDEERWECLWLRFAKRFNSAPPPPPPTEAFAADDQDTWIDEVIRSFCRHIGVRQAFANFMERQ